MARRVGVCKNCGDPKYPTGNVFTVKPTWEFELHNPRGFESPKSDHVKVCNNCGYPHPFSHRISARKRKMMDYIDKLSRGEE